MTPFAITVLDEPLVIWRAGDRVVAMEDRCIHRLAPLSRGRCEGVTLRCMYHGLLFNADGKVIEIPGQDLIPTDAKVRTFPAVEKHSWIWVWMGDPAQADEALIPPAVGFDDPNWIISRGTLDYEAEARLINDNLLDFSHFPFVHEKSLGADPEYATRVPTVTALPNGARSERWTPRGGAAGALIDSWMRSDYVIPGILLNLSGNFPLGTAASCKDAAPDVSLATDLSFSSQAATPIGPKKARYFFSFATHREQGNEAMHEPMVNVIHQAFAEDRAMIEAQQRIIDATPDVKIMPTANDRAVTIFNQLVARMAKAERLRQPAKTARTAQAASRT
jgi:vanillate O-demethylase monooxygenase subunit